MTVAMTQDTFHRLRAMIYTKSGLEFPESKKYLLESRLKQRLADTHCRTYEEYFIGDGLSQMFRSCEGVMV